MRTFLKCIKNETLNEIKTFRLNKERDISTHIKQLSFFSATNFSSFIIELCQLHDKIQIKWNYEWINYNIAIGSHSII